MGLDESDQVAGRGQQVAAYGVRGDVQIGQVLAQERLGELQRLLELLTPHQREVLLLRVAVGMSAQETAAAVGSTPSRVRVTQHHALVRLRAEIASRKG